MLQLDIRTYSIVRCCVPPDVAMQASPSSASSGYITRYRQILSLVACMQMSLAESSSAVLQKLEAYEEWFHQDHRVAGMIPWHWETRSKVGTVLRYLASSIGSTLQHCSALGVRCTAVPESLLLSARQRCGTAVLGRACVGLCWPEWGCAPTCIMCT